MRIMMTTDTVGGVWTFTSELTQGLLARGHEVSLLSLGRLPNQEQFHFTRDLSHRFPGQFRYTASEAPLEWMESNARCWDESYAAIGQALHGFDAEIIHGNQLVVGQYSSGLPTLITAHSDILSWAEACQPEGLPSSTWRDTALKLTREGLAGADTLVAPTEWMAGTITRLYGEHYQPTVIPNGRDIPVPRSNRKLQAVSVGRLWDPAKGLDLVVAINSPISIVVAGATSYAQATAPALPNHIEVQGLLSQDTLAELFASSSLYLATSRYEPFGLAPLEAALCGCAVLARDLPVFHEVWGDAALYFASAAALEAILHHLAANPPALAHAQARSLAQARRYTRATMTDAYLREYDQLLMRSFMPPYDDWPETAHAV